MSPIEEENISTPPQTNNQHELMRSYKDNRKNIVRSEGRMAKTMFMT